MNPAADIQILSLNVCCSPIAACHASSKNRLNVGYFPFSKRTPLTESIDTTTPGGLLIFHVFGALGQFERDLIRERTRAVLVAAAALGRKGGRKPVVTADKLQRAREYIATGLNVREAASRLRVSKTALYAALQNGRDNDE